MNLLNDNPKLVNYLINKNVKIQFDTEYPHDLYLDILEYLDDLEGFPFRLRDVEDLLNIIEHNDNPNYHIFKVLNLIKDNSELLEKSIVFVLDNTLYDNKRELSEFIEKLVDNKFSDDIINFVSDKINNELDAYEIYEDSLNKLNNATNKQSTWEIAIINDTLGFDQMYKDLDEIIENVKCEVFEEYAERIAYYIDNTMYTYFNRKEYQFRILKAIFEKCSENVIEKILEYTQDFDEESFYDQFDYNKARLDDRKNNRITTDEAREIIMENDLENKLEVIEGKIYLEDMTFDHLRDKATGEDLYEDNTGIHPDRVFGDNKMSKSWFNEIIEKYKKGELR